jgi:chromosome segregation ATPase
MPLRLPERVLEALDELAELRSIRSELTRVREQTEPLGELLPTLERLNEDLGTRLGALHETLAPVDERLATVESTTSGLASEMRALHETVRGVQEDIQRMSGLRGERGMAERARDRIVGGKD